MTEFDYNRIGEPGNRDLLAIVREAYPVSAMNILTAFVDYRDNKPGFGHHSVHLTPLYEMTGAETELWDRLFDINRKLKDGIDTKLVWLPVTDIMSEFASGDETPNTDLPDQGESKNTSCGLVQKSPSTLDHFQRSQFPRINLFNHVQIQAPIVKATESDTGGVRWFYKPSAFLDRTYGAAMYLQVFPLHRDGRPFLWSFHVPTVQPTNLGVVHPVLVEFGFNTQKDPNKPNVITIPHEEPVLNGTKVEHIYDIECSVHDLSKTIELPQSDKAALAFYQMSATLKKSALPEGPKLLTD